jgi:hypothetical protein
MSVEFKDFGFYNIDMPYLKYLHDNVDTEIYYSEDKAYDRKPFLLLRFCSIRESV